MIILSVGMPRAGSGWYYNLTNELMLAVGAQDARRIRQRYHLQHILTEVNCNIGALTTRRLLAVLVPSLMGNTFVVKAHAAPTPMAKALIRRKWMQAAYIYRDPRDALLSAYENGERARTSGRLNAFSSLVDFETALEFMRNYVEISLTWLDDGNVLHTRFEDLLQEYDREAGRLAQFLGIEPCSSAPSQVIARFRPEKRPTDGKGLHFSHGKTGRFRTKMSAEQQDRMAQAFAAYLERMEYPV